MPDNTFLCPDKLLDEKPQEIAVIDLGSNSFHLLITRIVNETFQVIGRVKEHIHLADGLDSYNYLSEDAIERGLACLRLFAKRLQGFSKENVRIVATYTLRRATNSALFIMKAREILPYPIEIISGQEEARLIYMGLAHTQPEKGRKLVIDIGGGSTELVIGEEFVPLLAESRHMGCVVYTQKFFPDHKITKFRFIKTQLTAEQQLENIAYKYRQCGWNYAFGSSGTIKAIINILNEMGYKDGYITRQRLEIIVNKVMNTETFAELKFAGLSDARRDIFVAGLAILCAIFNALEIKKLYFSTGALREGVLYEMEQSRFRHHDIRSRTATNLAEHYNIDREQADRVLTTTRLLYQQWYKQNQHLADSQLETLLNWAALLHEVGLSINYSNIQQHSAYILRHSNLPGFNQEHQLILSTLVKFHRKALKINEIPEFNLFSKEQILPLIQLLRLAVLFNNQRQASIMPYEYKLHCVNNHFTLTLPNKFLAQNNLLHADLEKEKKYWEAIQGGKLSIIADEHTMIN